MKKKLLSFAALATMLFVPMATFAEGETDNTQIVYDFTALTKVNDLSNQNGSAANGTAFYVWENADKTDSYRQDFKGYTGYEGENLEAECHIWRRSDRLSGNLVDGGLKCPNDREMVINGITAGSIVKIFYDASATVKTDPETGEETAPAKILWVSATGAGHTTGAKIVTSEDPAEEGGEPTVTEVIAVPGETEIASGAEIRVLYTECGYFGFKVKKGMIISKIEIITAENTQNVSETPAVDDFEAEATPITTQPENVNGSKANGTAFYAWESADKTDSFRQDYKGYKWAEGLELPEECHVWRRSDRINNNVDKEGLKCPNDREMVIDGLSVGSVVKITYDASATVTTDAETGEQTAPKQILWVAAMKKNVEGEAGSEVVTYESTINAKIGDADAVSGETAIASGAEITVNGFVTDENHLGGYIAVKVFKKMVIQKIEIVNGETTTTYDFTKLTKINDLTHQNGSAANGTAFYVWENEDKTDSYRQDFKGYKDYEGENLEAECHVWRRSDRLSGNLVEGGLKCPNNREMVINGITAGSIVKIFYDASATVTTDAETGEPTAPAKILWASATGADHISFAKIVTTTEAEEGGEPTVTEEIAVPGITEIASGAEIRVLYTAGGYFGFQVKKGMIISKIEITTAENTQTISETPAVNDFAAEATPVITQPENANGSAANGTAFYVWENEDKADSFRQDFKGYKWTEGLALPEECHVWRRNDRINNNIVKEGLKCPNNCEMVVDGLKAGSVVTITYDASGTVTTDAETGEQTEPKQILYATGTGAEPATFAKINGELAVSGTTTIASDDRVCIAGTEKGYFGFRVYKNMIIKKIVIDFDESVIDPTVGINEIGTSVVPAASQGAVYNLQGVRVSQPTKGLYIKDGKKVFVK